MLPDLFELFIVDLYGIAFERVARSGEFCFHFRDALAQRDQFGIRGRIAWPAHCPRHHRGFPLAR